MQRLLPLLTALLALMLAPAAHAGWFGAESIDGPAEVEALGDVDLARDGTGGVVYTKREAGVPQVFLSRLSGGRLQAPERLSAGPPVREAAVAAVDRGRLVVAWIAGGQVLGTVIPSSSEASVPAVALGGAGGASGLAVDMSANGVAYAVWSEPGGGGADVRAARLDGATWSPVGAPLDIDPARSAGSGASRPRVGVGAENNAVVSWGETGGDGRNHVYSRRLIGLALSAFPQDLTLDTFENQPAGNADSPDLDIQDDGSFAWVAFRQDVGGRSRSVARRLRGTLFDAPVAIDGGATSSAPRIDFTPGGIGAAVTAASDNATFSAYLDKFDRFQPAVRIDQTPSGTHPTPVVATSGREDAYAAWRTGAGDGSGAVHARRKDGEGAFGPEFTASNPSFGAVAPGQVAIGADRAGNAAVAMVQGGPGARRLTVAVHDLFPGSPSIRPRNAYRGRRPVVSWSPGTEDWGRQVFTLLIDGKPAGTTSRRRITSTRRVGGRGLHRLQVVATDIRGQSSRSRTYRFRVDAGVPMLSASARRSGRLVRVTTRARDRGRSGLRRVVIDFGDGSKTRSTSASHRYARPGRYTITVTATDRAGNATTRRLPVRIG